MPHQQPTSIKVMLTLMAVAALVAGGYAIQHTASCFLSAFVIAYLLDPLVSRVEKSGYKRLTAIILLYCIMGLLSVFFLIYLVPLVTMRWESLLKSLPFYIQKVKELIISQKGVLLDSSPATEEMGWLLDTLTGNVDKISAKLGSGIYSAASRVAFNLFNLVLAPILVFFMLYYKHAVIEGIKIWLPSRQRDHILVFGREVNVSIGGYIRGQLIVSLIVAVFSTIALFFLDVDYALLNGIFAGLASILPFIGVILATLPPLFFAYIKFQSTVVLIKVIAVFAAIYFLEGYLIKPLVFKESMNLNPLMTIVVVMAFGEMMGFWGILLAIPIAAAIKIFTVHWRRGDFSAEV
ncbi:MAG TPA: AI-2E family transporter [Geobacteraceae bacterium]|nr:AI-2E family transporter [Geobacteraceae bacterium]